MIRIICAQMRVQMALEYVQYQPVHCAANRRKLLQRGRGGLQARGSVRRMTRTWTESAMTDECLGSNKAREGNPHQNGDWRDSGAA
ncbi:MAG TPA: hypothetical protein VGC19_15395 [Rhodanobacter sp.]